MIETLILTGLVAFIVGVLCLLVPSLLMLQRGLNSKFKTAQEKQDLNLPMSNVESDLMQEYVAFKKIIPIGKWLTIGGVIFSVLVFLISGFFHSHNL